MYLITVRLFFFDPMNKNKNSAARAGARAQRVVRKAINHSGFEEKMLTPAQPAEKNLPRSTSRDYSRPGRRASTRLSRLTFGLDFTALWAKKRRLSISHER